MRLQIEGERVEDYVYHSISEDIITYILKIPLNMSSQCPSSPRELSKVWFKKILTLYERKSYPQARVYVHSYTIESEYIYFSRVV